ncbi:MAG: hypothetical protein QOH62_3141 [Solirubrobacteraceae bacterium]|jgi:hypothetical protein|nr:hypothetical protein [Solirubrobacteraceae bacterium]
MTFLRFLDVAIVVFFAPIMIVAGAPLLGYVVGAAGWTLARAGGELLDRRARTVDPRTGIGLQVAGMMGRAWVVGLAVVGASLAGGRDDAVCAAVVALIAFTVYFALSIIVRQSERNVVRP